MPLSLAGRIWIGFAAAVATAAVPGTLLLFQLRAAEDTAARVRHSEDILREASQMLTYLTLAESDARGFAATGDQRFLDGYRAALEPARENAERLDHLTVDEPERHRQVREASRLADGLLDGLNAIIERRLAGSTGAALIGGERGIVTSQAVRARIREILEAEDDLLTGHQAADRAAARRTFLIIGVSVPVFILMPLLLAYGIVVGIRRPLRRLTQATDKFGGGDLDYRVPVRRDDEIGRLAVAFNQMAERLAAERKALQQAETELQASNRALAARGAEAEARSAVIDVLGRMAHRLQSCISEDEFAEVVRRFAPQVLPDFAGALFLMANSRNQLRLAAAWNDPVAVAGDLHPDDCWALRHGRAHVVEKPAEEVPCRHIARADFPRYRCQPLMAQGDVVGLLYIEDKGDLDSPAAGGKPRLRLTKARIDSMGENIALALANYRLRETLRSQSIRDPLTGLFNRRFLEEALAVEFARAVRNGTPVALIMIDIDHFKRFNTEYGHDGGDTLLRAVGRLLAESVRKGDIACRYGGEEFTLILPGADLAVALNRAEKAREAAAALDVRHAGERLGRITLSAGIAVYPADGDSAESVLRNADLALMRAKELGRNRIESAGIESRAAAS